VCDPSDAGRPAGARIALFALAVAASALFDAGIAHAHPQIERVQSQYDAAEFDDALRLAREAEEGHDLTQADLVALLELKALLHLATGDTAAMQADVRAILAIAPAHTFSPASPPELVEAADAARRTGVPRVSVDARAEARDGRLELRADAVDAPAGLVRAVRIRHTTDDGAWTAPADAPISLPVPAGGTLAWSALVVGPGDAIVAQAGSEEAPLRWPPAADSEASSRTWLWVGIGAGVVAVAAGVIVTAVLLSHGESDETAPQLPAVARLLGRRCTTTPRPTRPTTRCPTRKPRFSRRPPRSPARRRRASSAATSSVTSSRRAAWRACISRASRASAASRSSSP
jgi:hypothetical protein